MIFFVFDDEKDAGFVKMNVAFCDVFEHNQRRKATIRNAFDILSKFSFYKEKRIIIKKRSLLLHKKLFETTKKQEVLIL